MCMCVFVCVEYPQVQGRRHYNPFALQKKKKMKQGCIRIWVKGSARCVLLARSRSLSLSLSLTQVAFVVF